MNNNLLVNRLSIAIWIGICIILGYVDLAFISQNIGVDSDLIMQFRDSVEDNAGNAYRNTALFFRLIPNPFVIPFVLAVSSYAIFIFMKDVRRIPSILMALYITLPAMALFLSRPQKETIVTMMTIMVIWTLSIFKSRFMKISIIALIYIVYALLMRQYYFLILFVFLALCLCSGIVTKLRISWGVFWILVTPLLLLVLTLLPKDVFMELQGVRDTVNYNLGADRFVRTAFLNPFPPDNGFYFVLNYIYSLFRLNVPIFFTFSYKEIVHMISIYMFARLIIIGLGAKASNPNAKICAQLVLAHVAVLTIFEPDLGSYLRHLVSVFLYLTPLLILYDTREYGKIHGKITFMKRRG